MASSSLDIRASVGNPPGPEDRAWLIVCRRCGFHCELREGSSWRGCPDCGGPLTAVFPDDSGLRPLLAEDWHDSFRPRRRRNAWRTSPPMVKASDAGSQGA